MKITDVRASQPIAPESPPDWRTSIGQILVTIETDAGLSGYGVGGGGLAGVHVVNTVLRELLRGRETEPIGEIWEGMYEATLPFGRKGIAIMALSGVDLALWDLKGKRENRPVAQAVAEMAGASPHGIDRAVPVYVTVWDEITPVLAKEFRAFKLHVENFPPAERIGRVVDLVARARSAIGPDCPLMIDAWMKWDVPTTLAIAERLLPHNVGWIEEPLPADDYPGYAELTRTCPIPIAGGEHEFTARGFAELIDRRLHHVLQPDVCWCGGMTELIKIYHLARKAGLRVCPHRGAEIWGLHAIAALDPEPLAETGRPWMTWLGGQPLVRAGFIHLPGTAGFGVHVLP